MSDEQTTEPAANVGEPLLNPLEARILGVLIEKQHTTPDYYPMTLNALMQACNQKTSRSPVMKLNPGEVGHGLNQLRDRGLIGAAYSGRTERYEQKLVSHLSLDRRQRALICVLMLRGAETLGELRTHAGRMAEFLDLADVKRSLDQLIRRDQPLVEQMPKAPGRREERYRHLLCGIVYGQEDVSSQPAEHLASAGQLRIDQLEEQLRQMRSELDRLWLLTGLQDQQAGEDEA